MNDIMIDLETLSTRHDAAILSIGACYFDIKTGEIGEQFHQHLLLSGHQNNAHISLETVSWWLGQAKQAQEQIINSPKNTIHCVLSEFSGFRNQKSMLWSNGSSFDLAILRNAYQRAGVDDPWNHWQERDVRTIVDICRNITGIDTKKETDFDGTKHDALADAIHQAKYVSRAFNILNTPSVWKKYCEFN